MKTCEVGPSVQHMSGIPWPNSRLPWLRHWRLCQCMLTTIIGIWLGWLPNAAAHEGHEPLPASGVKVDIVSGKITLAAATKRAADIRCDFVRPGGLPQRLDTYFQVETPWTARAFVTSRLPGRVAQLHVGPGDAVERGQVLVEVESLELLSLRLEVLKASSNVEVSRQVLDSMREATNTGAIPKQRYYEAETALQQYENELAVLHAKVAGLGLTIAELTTAQSPPRLRITSPLSGTVVHAEASLGRAVEPIDHLLEIVDNSRIWIRIGVLERDIGLVRPGLPAILSWTSSPHHQINGQISRLGWVLDDHTSQGSAWIDLAQQHNGNSLLAGMVGQASVTVLPPQENVVVARTALHHDAAGDFVLVESAVTMQQSVYQQMPVKVLRRSPQLVEIQSAQVQRGDRVVSVGGNLLANLLKKSREHNHLRSAAINAGNIDKQNPTSIVPPKQQQGFAESPMSDGASIENKLLTLDGIVEVPPEYRIQVSSPLAGKVQAILVDRSDEVTQGSTLIEVASFEFQSLQLDLLAAHLDYELWTGAMQRLQRATDVVSKRSLVELRGRVTQATSHAQVAREKLFSLGLGDEQIQQIVRSRSVIESFPLRAPGSGRVVEMTANVGQTLLADQPICEIQDPKKVWIKAFLTRQNSFDVTVGQAATIRLTSQTRHSQPIAGHVVKLSPTLDNTTGLRTIWIAPNDEARNIVRDTNDLTTPLPSASQPQEVPDQQFSSAIVLQCNMLAQVELICSPH